MSLFFTLRYVVIQFKYEFTESQYADFVLKRVLLYALTTIINNRVFFKAFNEHFQNNLQNKIALIMNQYPNCIFANIYSQSTE